MNDTTENYENNTFTNSKEKIFKVQELKEKSLSEKTINKNSLNESKKIINNEEILLNTAVNITVELGKSKIKIKDFLSLSQGSMLILDKLIKEPLEIFMNGHLIASGEIVILEEKYGLRITSITNSSNTKNL